MAAEREQVVDGVQRDVGDQRGFVEIGGRQHEPGACAAGGEGDWQDAGDRAHRAGKTQLADQFVAVARGGWQLTTGDQDANGDGEVEAAALLGQVGRSEIDRDTPRRKLEAGVEQGAAHAVAAFLHGLFRQTDDIECRQAIGEMGLDADEWCVDADGRAAVGGGE